MKYKVQRKPSNQLDMRLFNLESETVMGYIWGWVEHGMTLYRSTVTHKGFVHGSDHTCPKEAVKWILEKHKALNTGLV